MTNGSKELEALADPTRRAIFERLARHPHAVGELARLLPVTRPAVSQHLKVLGRAGLVLASCRGTRRIYRADPRGVERMRQYLDRLWTSALDSFKAFAEREEE